MNHLRQTELPFVPHHSSPFVPQIPNNPVLHQSSLITCSECELLFYYDAKKMKQCRVCRDFFCTHCSDNFVFMLFNQEFYAVCNKCNRKIEK